MDSKKPPAEWIDPSSGIVLTPSYHGEQCRGNGEHPGIECCCNECDHYLACFPEFDPDTAANFDTKGIKVSTPLHFF